MAIGPHETCLRAPTADTAPGVPTLSTVAMAVDSEVLLTMPKAPTLTVAVILWELAATAVSGAIWGLW